MTKFEMGETYKTRSGLDAELVHAYYYEGDERLVWVVRGLHYSPHVAQTLGNGCMYNDEDSQWDVLPPKKTGTVWVNIEPSWAPGRLYESRELADEYAGNNRMACIEVTWEEGQGLEEAEDVASLIGGRTMSG